MWIQISAGLAPIESCRFVYLFLNYMKKSCIERKIKVELIDYAEGEKKNTIKSAFLKLSGENAKEYANTIEGSMLWVCKSEFRPNHKRKNWFIEIEIFDEDKDIELDMKDIKMETMRCSGNGGQNVNKLETGVRVTHTPTGIMAKAQEERSQYQNRKLAMVRLKKKLDEINQEKNKKLEVSRWQKHQNIQRGNSVKVFKGREFREVL